MKITLEQFKSRFQNGLLENIEILEFDGIKQPMRVKCKLCGQEKTYSVAGNALTTKGNKLRCCYDVHNKMNLNDFQKKIDNKFGKGKLQTMTYIKANEPVKVYCLRCKEVKEWASANHIDQIQIACAKCDKKVKTIDEVQEEINDLFGKGEFTILEYKISYKPITVKHKCGFICKKRDIVKLRNMSGCPICDKNISKGERFVASFLQSQKIPYQSQYTFSDLRGEKYPLRFDFAVLVDGKLFGLIEFDGQQHYGESTLFEKPITDEIKDKYCKDHTIPLLRIPYWEIKNLNNLIINFLKFNDYPLGEYTSSEVETLN